jgi:Tol biopolymer transport system component
MQPNAQGFYQIYTLAAPAVIDGAAATGAAQLINATHPGVPTGVHQGTPMWSASGNYLMFISQKPSYSTGRLFGIPDYGALPGFGTHDDLWVVAADGSGSWQLTNEPDSSDQGILLAVFSPDGQHVAWSDRQPGGSYVIKVADFVTNPQPALTNIRSYTPGGAAYYEPGSFTSDGRSFLYTSDQDTGSFWESQIYLLDLATGTHMRLTQGTDYNEHPVDVATPTGDWVIYMSDAKSALYGLSRGTDWYAMRIDGSGTKRLTQMNVAGSPEYTGSLQVAGRVAISPSGTFYLGDVQNSLVLQTGDTLIVKFTCP